MFLLMEISIYCLLVNHIEHWTLHNVVYIYIVLITCSISHIQEPKCFVFSDCLEFMHNSNMNAFFFFDFLWFIYKNVSNSQELLQLFLVFFIIHADTRHCTLLIWAVVFLLSESSAIINNLDVILHGFILQIIYTRFSEIAS